VVEPTDEVGRDTTTKTVRRREKQHDEGEGVEGRHNKGGGHREPNAAATNNVEVYRAQPDFQTTRRHSNPNTHKSNDTREWTHR